MLVRLNFLKGIDYIFLFSILLIVQGDIQYKIIGLLFLVSTRFGALSVINGFSNFYILILGFHLLYGTFLCFLYGFEYLPSFFLVFLFWLIPFIIHNQLVYFVKNNSDYRINKTINLFFIICFFVVILQFIGAVFYYKSINPYSVTPAAGDKMKSIFSNSSVSMIVMSFFFLKYLFEKKWNYFVIALICILLSTYMAGIFIFIISIVFGLFFFSKVNFKYKLSFVFVLLLSFFVFKMVSPNNVNYAFGYIERILDYENSNMPFKIKSFFQTLNYWTDSSLSFIFGSGGGNFSSRAAFIVSGDYVNWYPNSISYASDRFSENHLSLWTHDFNNPWDNRNNTANQPFSFYNQLIGEYGLIGLLLFYLFYIRNILIRWKILTYSKFMLIALLGYFVLDYWYEYFSVVVIFELLFLKEIKHKLVRGNDF